MTEKPDPIDLANIEELLISNTIQLDAVTQLLIQKGFITKDEFSDMLKQIQTEYQDSIAQNLSQNKIRVQGKAGNGEKVEHTRSM